MMKLRLNNLKIIFTYLYNFFNKRENIFFIICAIFISIIFTKTGHIQDDALITFRTAKNFSIYGQLSYNLGESLPGSTSIFYALICSIFFKLRFLIEDRNIFLLINTFNSVLLSFALIFLSRKLNFKNKVCKFLILFNPYFITLSHRGMETPIIATWLIFLLINMFEDDSSSKIFVFIFSLLLCSFRIDGIIFPFLVISSNYLYLLLHSVERFKKAKIFKKLKYCILGSLIGLIVNIVLNIKFFNSFLPHTALAKRIAYDQDLGFNTLLSNFSKYFIGHKSFLIPIPNNFEFIGIFSPIIIFIIVFFLFRYLLSENKKINSHESNNLNNFLIKLDLGIIGFIYPLVFLGLGKHLYGITG